MAHSIAQDAVLLAQSKAGDRTAFSELVARYQELIARVSFRQTRDEAMAQDIAQEAFVVAWHNLGQLRETSRFRPWLCRIASNLAKNAAKRNRELSSDDLDDQLIDENTPFALLQDQQSAQFVRTALTQIPPQYRDVLAMYYHQEQSISEVAKSLGITQDAAMQRLSRGRRYLAARMTATMETSLAQTRNKQFVGNVLAALPPVMSPASHPLPFSQSGATMIKFALIAASLAGAAAAGGVAVYKTSSNPSSTSSEVSSAPTAAVAQSSSGSVRSASNTVTPAPTLPPLQNGARQIAPPERILTDAEITRMNPNQGPSRGNANAPVQVVVYADLQCPYCGKVLGTLDQLFDEYPNQLRLVFKHMPLPQHEFAELAAEASMAAAAQGKFWEFHDLTLASQDDLSRETLLNIAKQIGLDVPRFRLELDSKLYANVIAADVAVAKDIEITATPSFVINGRQFAGAWNIKAFRSVIDSELAAIK
jgi:RNA polymerase sigma factor (sigma-70 family)